MKPIAEYDCPNDVRQIMANARRAGDEDVYRQAFKRLCELEGKKGNDPIERDFYAMLTAYEQLLTQKNGRTTRATRTRQMLKRKSMTEVLEDWAISKSPTMGFEHLVSNGLVELTGEYLVTKYPEKFSAKAVSSAKRRLAKEIK